MIIFHGNGSRHFHNKDLLVERLEKMMKDSEVAQYIWGAAFHWYSGDHFNALDVVHTLQEIKGEIETKFKVYSNCELLTGNSVK